jgi:hypothetical protein
LGFLNLFSGKPAQGYVHKQFLHNSQKGSVMNSQYLALSKQSVQQAMTLTDEQKKQVAGYEKELAVLADSVNMAMSKISKDLADKKLTDVQAIIERANVEALGLAERKTLVARIQAIYPAWTDTIADAIKIGAEKTAQATEFAGTKAGEGLGSALQVPVSAAMNFWGGLKAKATQRLNG